tara:strand:+ start:1553 stop:2722 length:1170 start_codon:yes stop_codon:yes gene_type:complete
VKKSVAIIGGGPTALIAAYFLSDQFAVTIYEKEKTIGRKFLVAGKGGFNLTNAKKGNDLIASYSPSEKVRNPLTTFSNKHLRMWLAQLYIPTYEGSSGRIFPEEGIKPISVLRRIEYNLLEKGVHIKTGYELTDFTNEQLTFANGEIIKTDYSILALGGASWKKTGSDGNWIHLFNQKGIKTSSFEAANCGVTVNWAPDFLAAHEGKPLKNIAINFGGQELKGEATVTHYGLEGNIIYPLVSLIRNELNKNGSALIELDLKPHNTAEELKSRLGNSSNYKDKLQLSPQKNALLKQFTTKAEYVDHSVGIQKVKALPIRIEGLRPIDEAISTIGGVDFESLNDNYSLKAFPNVFCAGEMINWDAPTGGFLLQGCFSTGFWVAKHIALYEA